jgi:hypothetical protein
MNVFTVSWIIIALESCISKFKCQISAGVFLVSLPIFVMFSKNIHVKLWLAFDVFLNSKDNSLIEKGSPIA